MYKILNVKVSCISNICIKKPENYTKIGKDNIVAIIKKTKAVEQVEKIAKVSYENDGLRVVHSDPNGKMFTLVFKVGKNYYPITDLRYYFGTFIPYGTCFEYYSKNFEKLLKVGCLEK